MAATRRVATRKVSPRRAAARKVPAKEKPTKDETLADRIDFLIELTGGQCPYGMVVKDEEEAREAKALLKKSRKPGAKLIEVQVKERP